MDQPLPEGWEGQVQRLAREFRYPPTPDLRRATRPARAAPPPRRRLVWALVGLLALIVAGVSVPPLRAGIASVLRLGAVQIQVGPPPTVPAATSTSVVPLHSVLELAGETTLEAARAQVPFPIRLPTYPPELGSPDQVFVQYLGAPIVVLVWTEPDDPTRARMSLHLLGNEALATKSEPTVVEEVEVGGTPALWLRGPHLLKVIGPDRQPSVEIVRLVTGDVLVWQQDGITYRLETTLPAAEAVRVAESLR